ncbi:hypothetical protein SLA2020_216040 [Shorea laevis]
MPHNIGYANPPKLNGFSEDSHSFPSNNVRPKEVPCLDDACSLVEAEETISEPGSLSSHGPDPDDENVICKEDRCQGDLNAAFKNPITNMAGHSEASKEFGVTSKIESQILTQKQGKPDSTVTLSTSNGSLVVPDSISKPKILLVEDNKVNVIVTQSMMRQLGHAIDVNNGVEAVRAVQSNNYDLILMDVCMPVMDDLQATRLIRSFEEAGNWDAAAKAGIEQLVPSSNLLQDGLGSLLPAKQIPIIVVSSSTFNLSN